MARVSGNILQPWMGRVDSLKMSVLARLICTLTATALKIRVTKSMEDVKAVVWKVASPGGEWLDVRRVQIMETLSCRTKGYDL